MKKAFLIFLLAMPVGAAVHDDVGFSRLKKELGDQLPTGKGLSIAQVEASTKVVVASGQEKLTWLPDTQTRDLKPYGIVDKSAAPTGAYSAHATAVARRLLGRRNDHGMASEIDSFWVYSNQDWLGDGMLRAGSNLAPRTVPYRLINHSWVGGSRDTRILRRSDWLTNQDEVTQVVGVGNAEGKINRPLMTAAFNSIAVGRSDGKHSTGTPPANDLYVAGRTRPHLVAPLSYTSSAAPTVASAVLLLLETAGDPALSTRSAVFKNRNGEKFHDAGRTEVIRAVLMASADRQTNNSKFGNVSEYRGSAEHRTDNGLDSRFGAGQLNVYNAWHILNAGEQEQDTGVCGFDYEPTLGNADAANHQKSYSLPSIATPTRLTTTLSWNLLFPYSSTTRFDISAVLADLNLTLYEIVNNQPKLLQTSSSRIDTTETIDAILEPGKHYRLVVSRADTERVAQDYALAWQMSDLPTP